MHHQGLCELIIDINCWWLLILFSLLIHSHSFIVLNAPTHIYLFDNLYWPNANVWMLSSHIHLLLSVHVLSVFVCPIVIIVNVWLLMRLNVPSIIASFLHSASRAYLYNSIFFTFYYHRLSRYEEYSKHHCKSCLFHQSDNTFWI